jgi:hypothetical protein
MGVKILSSIIGEKIDFTYKTSVAKEITRKKETESKIFIKTINIRIIREFHNFKYHFRYVGPIGSRGFRGNEGLSVLGMCEDSVYTWASG